MYYFVYGFLYLISLLPFFVLYSISSCISFFLFSVFGYRRKVVFENLRNAFPEKTETEIKNIASKFYIRFTDSFIEAIKMLSISKKELVKRAITENIDEVEKVIASGKNIQFLAGHKFNWEYGSLITAASISISFIGVYKRIQNTIFDKLFIRLRSRTGAILCNTEELPTRMQEIKKSPYALALIADQNTPRPGSAYWLNFFNRATAFIPGPEKNAIRNDTAVFFVKTSFIKRGYYKYQFILLTDDPSNTKSGELTLLYKNILEESVKEEPYNYLWSHRRWKRAWDPKFIKRWIDSDSPETE